MGIKNSYINASSHSSRWCVNYIVLFLLACGSLFLLSCTPVIKMVYGVHKPKYISDEAVIKYMTRLGLQVKVYRLKDYHEGNRKLFRYIGSTIPDVVIFNSSGQLVKFEVNCSNDLDSIVSLSTYEIDKMETAERTIQKFIEDTYSINYLDFENQITMHKPLYIVKFAEYAGKLNKDNVPHLIERLKSRNEVNYLLLNMDYSIRN